MDTNDNIKVAVGVLNVVCIIVGSISLGVYSGSSTLGVAAGCFALAFLR